MSKLSWREAIGRIERDDGDPDDMVSIMVGGRRRLCYHDDEDCPRLKADETFKESRSEAQDLFRPPCLRCVLGEEKDRTNQRKSLRAKLQEVA